MEPRTTSSLGHLPDGRWEFDESVTAVFDDMLRRSIPQYDVMRRAVFDVGSRFAKPNTTVLDLGSSRGDAIAPLAKKLGSSARFVCAEVSEPMLEVLRERFGLVRDFVDVRAVDLRRDFPTVDACSLVQSVLTLQFTPIEYRQKIVRNVYRSLAPGGAFILVEKVLGATADVDEMLVDLYLESKHRNGYTPEEIERKRLALEGALVPVTARWNEELLSSEGFKEVDCFWRWMNFAAWVAVRR